MMGKILGSMVIIFAVLVFILILCLFLLSDIRAAIRYKKAAAISGTVQKSLERRSINAYGSGVTGLRRRNYSQYEVTYVMNGKTYSGVWQTKEKELAAGTAIDLRYVMNEASGEPELVTRIYADRVRELAVGAVFAVILSAGIIFWKLKTGN